MLGRFQNSSVPVLNLSTNSVPVSIGFTKSTNFGTGFRRFSSTVLSVLLFCPKIARNVKNHIHKTKICN